MNKKRIRLLLLFIGACVVTTLFLTTKKNNLNVETTITKKSTNAAEKTATPKSNQPEVQKKEDRQLPHLLELIPKKDDVRKEVAANVEETPQLLIQFAMNAGKKIYQAMKSEESASDYLDELDRCLDREVETVAAVQSLCLKHAKIIEWNYPNLSRRFNEILSKTDPAIVKLSDLKELESVLRAKKQPTDEQ